MSQLPVGPADAQLSLQMPRRQVGVPDEPSPLRQMWWVVKQHIWLILGITTFTTLLAAVVIVRMTPIYSASVTLRIASKEPNLPEIFRTMTTGSEVSTEMGVLASRATVLEAVDSLSLRLRVVAPSKVMRKEVFSALRVLPNARSGTYALVRASKNQYELREDSAGYLGKATVGDTSSWDGFAFTLDSGVTRFGSVRFLILSPTVAVNGVGSALNILRPSRDADLLSLVYQDSDSQLVRQVPNAIAARYIVRRQELLRTQARSTAQFLREQIARLSGQLDSAEDQFRNFRQREHVIDPVVDGSKQVGRLIDVQAQRAELLVEREALQKSLYQVDSAAAKRKPGDESPYRELLGFPTLLKNPVASQLFASLAAAEAQRTSLLGRRTLEDPEVQVLTSQVTDLENQLHGIAASYYEGLGFQLASVDSSLQQFGRDLSSLPRKEVEYGRLARQTKTLEDAYTLLQTRLKEAQIAEAVQDVSVQVVDTAVTPLRPAKPQRRLLLMAAIMVGLLLSTAGAFLLDHMDQSIHTRVDATRASGLPVLGLIPSIPTNNGRIGIVEVKRTLPVPAPPKPPPPPEPPGPPQPWRARYTFFTDLESGGAAEGTPPPADSIVSQASAATSRIHLTIGRDGGAAAEAFSILQTNIAFSSPTGTVRSLVLTSPLPGDGKTTCAVNLAVTLAERGLRTLLVDCDLRRGTVHQAFGLSRDRGMVDVLKGDMKLRDAIQTLVMDGSTGGLSVVPAGRPFANPSGLVSPDRLRNALADVEPDYDRIIIDAPPVNVVTDAALLSTQADAVLLVARSGVTDAAALAYAVDQLDHVSAPLLGIVLNDIDFRKDSAYDNAYRYYTYHEYTSRD